MLWTKLIVLVSLFLSVPAVEKRTSGGSKIMQGDRIKDNLDYKYLLAMWRKGDTEQYSQFMCMGSALNFYYAVMPAHCLIGHLSTWKTSDLIGAYVYHGSIKNERRFLISGNVLEVGAIAAYDDPDTSNPVVATSEDQGKGLRQLRLVISATLHRDVKIRYWLWKNDIGVAYVKVPFDEGVSFAKFPIFSTSRRRNEEKYQNFMNKNHTCHAYGWGTLRKYTRGGTNRSNSILHHAEQVVVEWPLCVKFCEDGLWKQLCRSEQTVPTDEEGARFCAFREHGRIGGPCFGDSGTLLLCIDETDAIYAVAMLTGSLHCGQFYGGPFFYLKLTSYWTFLSSFESSFVTTYNLSYDMQYFRKSPVGRRAFDDPALKCLVEQGSRAIGGARKVCRLPAEKVQKGQASEKSSMIVACLLLVLLYYKLIKYSVAS